jgi:hypothetical protein
MQLKGKQFQQLQEALLSAFPHRAELKQMVRFGLDEVLDVIATGENYKDVVFKLIDWAETHGSLENLLIAARDKDRGGNSGNLELKKICEELLQGQTAKEQFHALMNPCNFDLTELIGECRDKLLAKKGVIGLGVSCNNSTFVSNFCERLKNELIEIRKNIETTNYVLSLDARTGSVKKYLKQILGYRTLLKTHDVIFPIIIPYSSDNSLISMATELWQQISNNFQDDVVENRFIIIMCGSEDSNFPERVINLKPPNFTKSHMRDWVYKVSIKLKCSQQLRWSEDMILNFQDKMIANCCLDSPESEQLDIESVYYYLDFTRNHVHLQPEAFLQEL